MSVLILGSTGYIGQAFCKELERRGDNYIGLSRKVRDYTDYNEMVNILKEADGNIELVISCAAYIPKESVSLCDQNIAETITANTILPVNLARVCEIFQVPFATISTGCLWNDGLEHSEDDPPQRAFKGYCGLYIGSKVLAENEVRKYPKHYIWRVRLPFDQFDSDRNYLSKLASFSQVWNQDNSCSHRGDFVKACLDLWKVRASWGTYNCTNTGVLNAPRVVELMRKRKHCLFEDDKTEVVNRTDGQCRLSVVKLFKCGVRIRPVADALDEALTNWIPRA